MKNYNNTILKGIKNNYICIPDLITSLSNFDSNNEKNNLLPNWPSCCCSG